MAIFWTNHHVCQFCLTNLYIFKNLNISVDDPRANLPADWRRQNLAKGGLLDWSLRGPLPLAPFCGSDIKLPTMPRWEIELEFQVC